MNHCFVGFLRSRLLVIGFLVSIGAWQACAQSSGESYELFTTRNGLPHMVVTSIYQDSKGYMWIGTLNGLCKYDGQVFTQLPLPPGCIINQVMECRSGLIWVATRAHGVLIYNRHTNRWISPAVQLGHQSINAMWEDPDGSVWIGGNSQQLLRLKSADLVHWQVTQMPRGHLRIEHLFRDRSGILLAAGEGGVWPAETDGPAATHNIQGLNGMQCCPDYQGDFFFISAQGAGFCDTRTGIWHLFHDSDFANPGAVVMQANLSGDVLLADPHLIKCRNRQGKELYACSVTALLKLYKQAHLHALLEDASGVIWLGTDRGLLKLIRPRDAFGILKSGTGDAGTVNGYVRSLLLDNEQQLWAGFKKGPVLRVRNPSSGQPELQAFVSNLSGVEKQTTINVLLRTRKGDLLCGGLEGLFRADRQRLIPFPDVRPKEHIAEVWSLLEDSTGAIWIGTNCYGLYIFHPSTQHIEHYGGDNGQCMSVWCMVRDRKNRVLLGTGKGLLEAQRSADGRLRFIPHNTGADGSRLAGAEVWSICEDSGGYYLIGTTDGGLNIQDTGWQHIRACPGSNKGIGGIFPGREHQYWLLTINGLQAFNSNNGSFRTYTEDDGLLSSDFNFKAFAGPLNGTYYLGTKLGVVLFHPDKLPLYEVPWRRVHITSFFVFDKLLYIEPRPDSLITLTHDANFFSMHFALTDYANVARHRFRYRLVGFDQNWRYAGYGSAAAQYTNVPHGTYTFQVQGVADGDQWGGPVTELQIVVKPAYWQKSGFRIAMILLGTGLIAMGIFFRFRTLIKREKEKNLISERMAELELRALQAQMNPHFIFNSVSAIQHFILKRDEQTANNYLGKFGLLMRLYLESSKRKFIPLDEELELIRLYVSLELMRFGNRFIFQLLVDPALQPSAIDIPSMLVQPFIENAINHGLMNKEGDGLLTVSFSLQNAAMICCVVEDDGIGRKAAAELREKSLHKHRSRGMELVYERLHTFSQLEGTKVNVSITDKTGPDGAGTGTRVTIDIPLN